MRRPVAWGLALVLLVTLAACGFIRWPLSAAKVGDSLNAAFGYYRTLSFKPPAQLKAKISVPTVVFAGTDDPIVSPADYHAAKRMFTASYTVEEMPGGHFMHREHPDIFAAKLLAHL